MDCETAKEDDPFRDAGFIPAHAGKEDLDLLVRFVEMQSRRKGRDEIDLLFSEKTALAKTSVLSAISQIKERICIKENGISRLDYCMGVQRNRLMQLEDLFENSYSTDVIGIKIGVEKNILDFEKEKIEQEASCWRDIMTLRKDLIFAMTEYKTNAIKKQLVSGSLEGRVEDE